MITPDQFASAPVAELLESAARGLVGVDKRWFDAIVNRGAEAVEPIVRFGVGDPEAHAFDISKPIIAVLYRLRASDSIAWFVEYLRSEPDIPDYFMAALRPFRNEALEPLLKLYEGMEEDEAGEVAFVLATLGVRDQRILKLLLDRLEYDLSEGAINLGLYGDPEARPALEALLEKEEDGHLRALVSDAIDQLGREIPDEEFHLDVADIIPDRALPEMDSLDDEQLIQALSCSDPEYRQAAADACINTDLSPALLTQLHGQARTDPSPEVRGRCWEAVGAALADQDDVYSELVAKVSDESAPEVERAGALMGLGQRAGEEEIRPWAEKFYESPTTRAAALAAMRNSLDRRYGKYFPPHLDDPDPEIRKQAISGVGYLGIAEAAEKLRGFFDDDEVRSNALFAYALCARTEVSPGRMRPFLRRIEQLAGGLAEDEEELVKVALDERLLLAGHRPVFRTEGHEDDHEHEHHEGCGHDHGHTPAQHLQQQQQQPAAKTKVGRNDPCPCGSGKKYKKCCGA